MTELLADTTSWLVGYRAPLGAAAIAFLVAWFATPMVRKFAIAKGAIDDPTRDDRRVHKEPTPRWGGIAIFVGVLVAVLGLLPFAYPRLPFPPYVLTILGCGAMVVIVGALDDLYQYKAKIQALFLLLVGVLVQFPFNESARVHIAGFALPWGDHQWVSLGWAAIPLTAFYIFVVTKTMDTIDGIDGLTAGISAIAATTLSIIATTFVLQERSGPSLSNSTYQEMPRIALMAAAVAGASIGFLRHNYNPARIFMGTGGAQFLGFMLACISIAGVLKWATAIALVVPMLAFGVPIMDAFIVVLRRIINRVPITQADKRHLHHTLLGQGLTQRQAVLVLYAAAATMAFVAYLVIRNNG